VHGGERLSLSLPQAILFTISLANLLFLPYSHILRLGFCSPNNEDIIASSVTISPKYLKQHKPCGNINIGSINVSRFILKKYLLYNF
jgi:hypothetical protein